MTAPVIPTLPAAPSRNDAPDTFVAKADAHVAALTPWTTAANSFGTYMDSLAAGVDADAATATTQAGIATTQAGNAATSATLAQDWATKTTGTVNGSEYSAKKYAQDSAASAASATLSPGTQATSTTSMSIGTGSKSFTLAQTGKNFTVGQYVAITRTSNPSGMWMNGAITAFNSGTGSITVDVVNSYGAAGPYTDWTVAQSSPIAPSTVAIGALRFSQDVGTVINPISSDPATYLRTGTVATAATYPNGALVDYIKAYGTGNSSIGAFVGDIAFDGNQTIVCTYDNANVMVSTNGGSTWSSVDAGIASSGIARSVCWTGTRFVCAGGAGTCQLSYSTNGTSWTTGATLSGSNTGFMRIRWDGSNCIIASTAGTSPNATITAARSADGSSAVGAALVSSATVYSVRDLVCMPSLGANRWLIITDNGFAFRSTASDGSAWSAAQALPFSTVYSTAATSNKFVIAGGANFYYSSTGLAGSWTQFTPASIKNYVGTTNTLSKNSLHWDGTRLWIGSNLGTSTSIYSNACTYTTDVTTFATWTEIQMTYPLTGQATYGAGIGPVVCGSNLLFIPLDGFVSGTAQGHTGTVNASYQTTWTTSPSYVGHSLPVTLNADGTNPLTRVNGYVRVA